ncbi:MAG: DinB family protein [Acidimicrobiales bacterium]
MDRCNECGFTYEDHLSNVVVDELSALGAAYRHRLAAEDGAQGREVLTHHPAPEIWSVLEYACHVRDVLLAQRERLFLALVEDRPSFAPIYRDRRAVLARYNEEDPGCVANEIVIAAGLVARAFGGLDTDGWTRFCISNVPEPTARSVEWLAQHTLHEGVHHLFDIDRILNSTVGRQ